MSAPELKPCPFCGGDIKLLESKNGSIVTFACQEDSSCIRTGLYILANPEKLSSAITSWNTRFPTPEIATLKAEVERLVKAIQGCESYINSRANNRTCDVSNHEQMAMKNLLNVFTQIQSALEGSHET